MKTLARSMMLLALGACSSDPPADNAAGLALCARLAEQCDAYEGVSITAADCHRYGHANNVTMCVAHQAECLAACPVATDAGPRDAAADASASDAGDAGRTQCQVIGTTCHASTSTLGQECHELGHHDDAAMCAARYAACIAECTADGGASDGGAHD